MAMRLADAGVPLAVVDVSEEALEPFRALDIPHAREAAYLAGDIVISMLPTETQVRTALLGAGGACTVRARRVVIDMSTVSPESSVTLAGDLAARGADFLDAPVSGGPAGARDGSLIAMVGGDAGTFESVRPHLAPMLAGAIHVGPTGSGHIVKALNNFLSAVTLWSTSEAMVVGERLGLDPRAMLEVWTRGSGRSHASEVKFPRHVLTGRYDFGQSLELFCKDIGIAAGLAARADAATPILDSVFERWKGVRDALGPGKDITEVARLLQALKRDAPAV